MKVLGAITFFCIPILFGSFLSAWLLSKLWLWFVAAQYGAGPSLGAWYGLAMIGRVAISQYGAKKDTDDGESFSDLAKRTVAIWAAQLFALGIAWLSGMALGWTH